MKGTHMTFRQNHEPQSLNDLIFHDPAVEQVLREYATGQRTKHLILHGPKGSGKSCAAQMILKERLPNNFPDMTTASINGRTDRKRKTWDHICMNWSFQNSSRGYTHIDEVDRYKEDLLDQLDEFLEHDRIGTIIMTTNHLENLDEWFTDRCATVELLRPTASDMIDRAYAILQAEGYNYSRQQVGSMLSSFRGSLRKMVEALETYVLSHPPSANPSGQSVTSAVQPAALTAGTVQLSKPQKLTIGGKSV
jgi:replication factor C subunit 3/5